MESVKFDAHFVCPSRGLLFKRLITAVPRVGDEIRVGGDGNELLYEVTLVVWVYDEPDSPCGRVNIGVKDGE